LGAGIGRVKAVRLSELEWEPFGWIPLQDSDPRDGDNRLAFDWGDAHVNVIFHTLDEVVPVDGGLRCDVLFRHDTHTQVLMTLDSEAVVAVAPARIDFSDPADASQVKAFLLRPQETIVLHRGTWHWGPFPLGSDRVNLFNVQGLRYAEDNSSVDLAAKGLSIDVLV
jgi:ureidoglycolate hydrolase